MSDFGFLHGICRRVRQRREKPGNTPGGDDRGEATKIVIYNGGSSEFSIVKGSDEDTAIKAIEDKYFEDTGVNLDFEVNYLGTSMKSKLSTSLSGGDQVDIVVSHTRGGEGLDEYVLANNCYYDIADLLEDYGGNILDSLSDNALSAVTTYDKKVIGIPSVVSPYKFGILVRKDYMEACGFTDDPTDTSKTFVGDMATFEKMLVAMKAHIEQVVGDCTHVVSGAIWDLEKSSFSGLMRTQAIGVIQNNMTKTAITKACCRALPRTNMRTF